MLLIGPIHQIPKVAGRWRRCAGVTDAGLAALREMPLTILDLEDCAWLTDAGLAALREMPLTQLNVEGCKGLSAEGRLSVAGLQEAWNQADWV